MTKARGGGGGGGGGASSSTAKARRGPAPGGGGGPGSKTAAAGAVAPASEEIQQHPSDILAKLFTELSTLAGRGSRPRSCSDPADAHCWDPSAVFTGSAAAGKEVEVTRHRCRNCGRSCGSNPVTHEPLSPSGLGSGLVLEIQVAGTFAIKAEDAMEAWRSRWERCSGCGEAGVGAGVEVTRHLVSVAPHLIVRFVPAAPMGPWNVKLPFKLFLGRSIKIPVSANGETTRKLRVVVVGKSTSKKEEPGRKRSGEGGEEEEGRGYVWGTKLPKPTGPSGNPSFLFFAIDQETRDYVMQDGPIPTPVSDPYALSSTDTMRVDWIICAPVDPLKPDEDDCTNDEFSAKGPLIDEGVTQWVGRWDPDKRKIVRFSNVRFSKSSLFQVRVSPFRNAADFDRLLNVFRNPEGSNKRAIAAGSAEPHSSKKKKKATSSDRGERSGPSSPDDDEYDDDDGGGAAADAPLGASLGVFPKGPCAAPPAARS